MDIEYITLEDNLNYIVTDKITVDNLVYVYLNQENNYKEFCIRKIDNKKPNVLVGLDNKEEFAKALMLFAKKYQVS